MVELYRNIGFWQAMKHMAWQTGGVRHVGTAKGSNDESETEYKIFM